MPTLRPPFFTKGSLRHFHLSWSILSIFFAISALPAFSQCTLNPASPSVTICQPANGATVSSPVHVVAGTTDNASNVTAMVVYVDNTAVYTAYQSSVDTTVNMTGGSHNLTINAWDASGAVFKTTEFITVSGTGQAPVSVAITPSSATVAQGHQQQFSATVLNTSNTAVTWYVDNIAGGSSSVGTISSTGLYTAPAANGTHNVMAVSAADTSKSDTAVVTVSSVPNGCTSPSGLTICSPAPNATVASPVTITAALAGATNADKFLIYIDNVLVYELDGSRSVNTSQNVAAGQHYLVAQAYVNGGWQVSHENFTVGSGQQVSVTVSPVSSTLAPGGTQQFTATVAGSSNTGVTWAVDNVVGGNASIGTVSTSGLYTAPSGVGNHTVTATSVADTTKSATATVTVRTAGGGSCTAPSQPGAVICTPTAGQTVNSPVAFTGAGTGASGSVNHLELWVDGAKISDYFSSTLNTSVALQNGTHTAALVEVDSTGAYLASPNVTFTVGQSNGTCNPPASPGAVICTPTPGQSVTSPVAFTGAGTGASGTVNHLELWIDGSKINDYFSNVLNTSVTLASGSHTAALVEVDSSGAYLASSNVNFSVGGGGGTPGVVSVTMHKNDLAQSGANTHETTLTPANVNLNQFGKKYAYAVDGQIYAQPLYLPNVSINGANHNTVFVATENNSVYAFDANGGGQLWHVNFGGAVSNNDPEGISPILGTTSTPVIDATAGTLYVLGAVNGGFQLHAIDVHTGHDKVAAANLTASVPGNGDGTSGGQVALSGACYQRAALVLANSRVYAAFGHCNHGWIISYDPTTLARKEVFNTSANGKGATIWMGGGAPAVDSAGNLYLITADDFDSTAVDTGAGKDYPDAFLKLSPTLQVLDYFIPANETWLRSNDADLGSGAPILLPGNKIVGGGKDGRVFLLNQTGLGGYNPSGTDNVVQSFQTGTQQFDNIWGAPAYWNNLVYFHTEADVLRSYSYNGSTLNSTPAASGTVVYSNHGASPSISANGTTAGIVWEVDDSNQNSGAAILHAYSASNVNQEIYNSSQNAARDQAGNACKFSVPTIADGHVFVPTSNELDVYGLLDRP